MAVFWSNSHYTILEWKNLPTTTSLGILTDVHSTLPLQLHLAEYYFVSILC